MRLRLFRPGDLPILYAIDQACFVPGISYSWDELKSFISHKHSQTWVAEQNAETAGFLIAQLEPRKILHIVTIDVLKVWRRRKVGSLLMDAAEQWATEQALRMVGLETASTNLGAQKFYKGRGYRKVDQIENYYADGTAAWVMVKELALAVSRTR